MERKVNIGQQSKVEIQWDVRPVDYSAEKADEIRSKMAIKYGIPKKNIHINPNFIKKNANGETEVATAEIAQNIQDPKFQQSLFRQFIDDNNIVDCNIEELLKIDDMMNSVIDYSVYDKYRRYKIEWVRWSNFLSYGEDNYINFSELNGLVLLKSEPANQGGKTNFACDLIKFLLFGSGDDGKSDVLKNIFNKHLPDATEVKVEGGIEIDGEHFIIRRCVTRPQRKKRTPKSVVTQKVEYFRVVDGTEIVLDDIDNLEAESNTKTNQVIKEAIGNKKDFNLVVLANSDNLKALISMKDKERGQLLTRWIGLAPLEEKFTKANDKWLHEIKPSLIVGRYNKEDLKAFITTSQNSIESLSGMIQTLNEKVQVCDNNLSTYNKQKEETLSYQLYVDPTLAKYDITTLNEQRNRLIEDGKKIRNQKDAAQKEFSEMTIVEFSHEEFDALSDNRDALVNEIAEIKANINTLKQTIDILTKGEYCHTCGQRLANVDNSSLIAQKKEEIEKLKTSGIEKHNILLQIQERLQVLKEVKKNRDIAHQQELKISILERDLAEKRAKLVELNDIINRLAQYQEAILRNNQIQTSLNMINVKIQEEEKIKGNLKSEIDGYNREINTLSDQISQHKIIINRINDEEVISKTWEYYLLMVGKNGISKMVLRQTLPIINAELNNLLHDVCDFDVLVEIDDSNHVNFSIIADDVKSNLLSGSGFEQTVAALALRAVLGNISTLPRPSFMLLDEVLGGVAKDNYDNVKKLYDRILKDYSFVFQITHLDDIADWHDTTVVVKKENRVSHISVLK